MVANIVPVVLSGGSGTRLWPLSRSMRPKQFINLVGEGSLFQQTLRRLENITGLDDPLIVCNDEHRFMVAEQMQELGRQHHTIILEPAGRNTAPAIASAAMKLSIIDDAPETIMMVLPADHLIENVSAFAKAVSIAAGSAKDGNLVTFGIAPTKAATGYGYIKASGIDPVERAVDCFVEKPDHDTAARYIEEDQYFWNSGMFLFRADTFLQELDARHPEILEHVKDAVLNARMDLDFFRLEEDSYVQCENISIDYAVMEKATNVRMVVLDANWSDIGSWSSLWDTGNQDRNGNVTRGDVWLNNVNNCYVHAESKMVAAVGVDDLIVVETHDGVMITSRSQDQEIKSIVSQLRTAGRPEADLHRKAYRPWGNYDCLDHGDRFQVKRIMVKSGQCTSMQKHFQRAEHWIVVAGRAEVTCGEETYLLNENESTFIPLGMPHRLRNPGPDNLEIIEVQSGSYLGEDDIVRLDDEYGRS